MKIYLTKILTGQRLAILFICLLAIAYTFVVGRWANNRFMSFEATLWDLGLMIQTIWNTGQGRILHESVNLGSSVSRLAVAHWEFIYLPLAVIYRVLPSVCLLLYLQTAILAAGMIPIYQFAVRKLESKLIGLMIAIAYLFYPALHGSNLFDLHGITFATTFLLFTFYCLDLKKWTWTIILAILSLSCREDVALIILFLGLYVWLHERQMKIGILLVFLCVMWIIAFFLRSHYAGASALDNLTNISSSWNHFGQTWMSEFVSKPFDKTRDLLGSLFAYQNIKYVAKLIVPVLGLCLLAPGILIISFPALLLNLLSSWHQMHQIEYHYTATIIPFIFLASIQGLTILTNWLSHKIKVQRKNLLFISGLCILLASIMSTCLFSIVRFHKAWRVSKEDRLLSQKLSAIPSELSVSVTARAGAHLTNRKGLYHFPEHASDVDLIILELNRQQVEIKNLTNKFRTRKVPAMNELVRDVFQDTTVGLYFVQNNVFCLKRGLDPQTSFAHYAFRDDLPSEVNPEESIELGKGLVFLGWSMVYVGERQAHFILFWKNHQQQSPETSLNLYQQWGEKSLFIPYQPIFGKIGINNWPKNKIIYDHLFVDCPEEYDGNSITITAELSGRQFHSSRSLFSFKFDR